MNYIEWHKTRFEYVFQTQSKKNVTVRYNIYDTIYKIQYIRYNIYNTIYMTQYIGYNINGNIQHNYGRLLV